MTQHDSEDPSGAGRRTSDERDGSVPSTDHSPALTRCEVQLRGPAELADALPYVLGYYPDDSLLLVALHGERGSFGGRVRVDIPSDPREWPAFAARAVAMLLLGASQGGPEPNAFLVLLYQDPSAGETGRDVVERLRPLARCVEREGARRETPVTESLCVSANAYWSYCCKDARCCPPEGRSLSTSGTSEMAAAAAYAGLQVRGSLREMQARLAPLGPTQAWPQQRELDAASASLTPLLLGEEGRRIASAQTLNLVGGLMDRFRETVPASGSTSNADAHDDMLLGAGEAAAVIIGLQDRCTRDRAAEWMEGPDAAPALRVWRALARRCVGPYSEHAAAPLSLAGWVAWSCGDLPTARVTLGCALRSDPEYVFAELMHRACSDGLDPEPLRRWMRKAQAVRRASTEPGPASPTPGTAP